MLQENYLLETFEDKCNFGWDVHRFTPRVTYSTVGEPQFFLRGIQIYAFLLRSLLMVVRFCGIYSYNVKYDSYTIVNIYATNNIQKWMIFYDCNDLLSETSQTKGDYMWRL